MAHPNHALTNTRLFVPYEEKDDAKALGARWDANELTWYAPKGANLEDLSPWLNPRQPKHINMEEDFRRFLLSHEVIPKGPIIADGNWHRGTHASDKSGASSVSYKINIDGASGILKNFKTYELHHYRPDREFESLNAHEIAKIKARKQALAKAAVVKKASVADSCARFLNACPIAHGHAYLDKKGVGAHGLYLVPDARAFANDPNIVIANTPRDARQMRIEQAHLPAHDKKAILLRNSLVIPICGVDGAVQSLQTISQAKTQNYKMYLTGGQKTGGFHALGLLSDGKPILIAEGYATAATLHEAFKASVVCAFDSHNLPKVANAIAKNYPNSRLYIMADNDHQSALLHGTNAGLKAAKEAAELTGAAVIAPKFDKPQDGSDFNDVAAIYGVNAMRQQVSQQVKAARDLKEMQGPMAARVMPYAKHLPANLRAFVGEVVGKVEAGVLDDRQHYLEVHMRNTLKDCADAPHTIEAIFYDINSVLPDLIRPAPTKQEQDIDR